MTRIDASTNIYINQKDTGILHVEVFNEDGSRYIFTTGDDLLFYAINPITKEKVFELTSGPISGSTIPASLKEFIFLPTMTEDLDPGIYHYEVVFRHTVNDVVTKQMVVIGEDRKGPKKFFVKPLYSLNEGDE